MNKRIRTLVVDDSAFMRTLLSRLLAMDPEIEVVGTAKDAFAAREKLVALKPDVMTLDVEMPGMDGVTFLGKVMEHFPVRTVMISGLTTQGAEVSLRALELGAVDIIAKPAGGSGQDLAQIKDELCARVKAAASVKLVPAAARPHVRRPLPLATQGNTGCLIAIAASTGGTEALKSLLSEFPGNSPAVLVVQHMPAFFTPYFAATLQKNSAMNVKVAAAGDLVLPGSILLAPGGFHMEVARRGPSYEIRLHEEAPVHGVRPAADYLLSSVARLGVSRSIGIILTGMGKDGAQGLLAMKNAGAFTIAQNEETSLVFGMPKEAIKIGAAQAELPLERIASAVFERLRKAA